MTTQQALTKSPPKETTLAKEKRNTELCSEETPFIAAFRLSECQTEAEASETKVSMQVELDPEIARLYKLYAAARTATKGIKVRVETVLAYALREWMDDSGMIVVEDARRGRNWKRLCRQVDAGIPSAEDEFRAHGMGIRLD